MRLIPLRKLRTMNWEAVNISVSQRVFVVNQQLPGGTVSEVI